VTNQEKADRLEELAFDAGYRDHESDAALLRESAQMWRERGEPEREYKADWAVLWERQYKGRTLSVTQARSGVAYWYVDSFPDYEATVADSLDAAKAAAIAWVDGQEGK
jgi:hypothetical protein